MNVLLCEFTREVFVYKGEIVSCLILYARVSNSRKIRTQTHLLTNNIIYYVTLKKSIGKLETEGQGSRL